MNAVCPSCGVAVVAGYVRCPKCHTALAYGGARPKRVTGDPGGTALPAKGFPTVAALVALGIAAVIALVLGLRSDRKKVEASPSPAAEPIEAVPANPVAPRPTFSAPSAAAVAPETRPTENPAAATRDLENALRLQRLWGRVEVTGAQVQLRSGSCADPAMRPLIESKRSLLRSAGLTRLRCVEQSGAVVFERDLGP